MASKYAGIFVPYITRIFPSLSWEIFSHVTRLDQPCASENIWWIFVFGGREPNFELCFPTIGFLQLLSLYTVMYRKKCTFRKWLPRLLLQVQVSQPENWYRLIRHVINYVIRHVMWGTACLCSGSFFDFFPFSWVDGFWILVMGSCFGELNALPHTTFNTLALGFSTVGTALFWLHLLVCSSRYR